MSLCKPRRHVKERNFLHSFLTSALHTSGRSASHPPPVYPRAGDHAPDCTTTSQHVPPKDPKPCLCQTSTMSVQISLTRVSQNCGPFCLLCLDLQTEILMLLQNMRDHVAVSECSCCGTYSADSLGLCSSS